ncbi:MAG TPA: hypothetical protein VKN99_22230 [Polyangia bacterium]|nr:hypothetical protein [Polyangia bacterium]
MGPRVCGKCGRPVAVKRAPACIYCGAPLPAQPADAAPQAPADPLLARVRSAFLLLARCRTEGDLQPALPWLGPDLREELQQEIEHDRRSGVRHVIDRVTVGAIALGGSADEARTARIDALYAEYWQDVRSHMILRGLRGAKPRRETWHLEPAPQNGSGVASADADQCPGCGAPLGATLDGKCSYCGLVPSANRLGLMLVRVTREDPEAVAAEWRTSVDAQLRLHRDDDPVLAFLTAVKNFLSD